MKGVKTARLEKFVDGLGNITCPEDGNGRFAPTGEPYITIMSSGITPEGEQTTFYLTEKEAVDCFIESVANYVSDCKWGLIYWRMRPKLLRSYYRYNYNNVSHWLNIYDLDSKTERTKQYTVRCRILRSNLRIKGAE